MTKVVHVIATSQRGGTEVFACRLATEFRSSYGIENEFIIAASRGVDLLPELEREKFRFLTIRAGRFSKIRMMNSIVRHCLKSKPNAVVIHFFNANQALACAAARFAGVRRLIVKAGNPITEERWRRQKLLLRMSLFVTRILRVPVISSSRWIEDSIRSRMSLPAGSAVIHNGCDFDAISSQAAAARSARRDNDTFVIGMVARIDPIKDHRTLIESVRILQLACPDTKLELRLVGDGVGLRELEMLTAELGLERQVKFLGKRGDIGQFLGGLDVFVMSTTANEGFGIVLIEALAGGVPVVASDVPACREVLDSGKWGVLVSPANAEKLGGALMAQLKRKALDIHEPDAGIIKRRSGEVKDIYGIRKAAGAYIAALGVYL